MWVYSFRFCFTPLAGVLFAFPSRYFCSIGRISYLAFDRGRPGFRQGFSCPAVLRIPLPHVHNFAYGAFTLSGRLSQNRSPIMNAKLSQSYNPALRWFRLLRFRSPLLSESLLFSFPGVLRWFSSPSLASAAYFVRRRMAVSLPPGYPIRQSTDHRMFAPPRRFSQLTTAFLASIRQGIRHKPYSRLTILSFLLKPRRPVVPGIQAPLDPIRPSATSVPRSGPLAPCQRSFKYSFQWR